MTTYHYGSFEISGFTRREAEAVALIAQGMGAKEAARAMGVSDRTTEKTLQNAMARIDARNRVHLVSKAFLRGWVRARDTTVCAVLICAVVAASIGDAAGWRKGPARRGREEHPILMVTATA